jgi:hypothetical protein
MADNYVSAVAYYAGRSQAMTRDGVRSLFEDSATVSHDDTIIEWYKRGYQDYVSEMERELKREAANLYVFLTEKENNND